MKCFLFHSLVILCLLAAIRSVTGDVCVSRIAAHQAVSFHCPMRNGSGDHVYCCGDDSVAGQVCCPVAQSRPSLRVPFFMFCVAFIAGFLCYQFRERPEIVCLAIPYHRLNTISISLPNYTKGNIISIG